MDARIVRADGLLERDARPTLLSPGARARLDRACLARDAARALVPGCVGRGDRDRAWRARRGGVLAGRAVGAHARSAALERRTAGCAWRALGRQLVRHRLDHDLAA